MPPRQLAPRDGSSGMSRMPTSSVGQGRQLRPESENWSGSHGLHATARPVFKRGSSPGLHGLHFLEPRGDVRSAAHFTHSASPGELRLPASHTVQNDCVASGTAPASQGSQPVSPYRAKRPALHLTHVPFTISSPAPHTSQRSRSADGAEPSSHREQLAELRLAT